MPDYELSQEGKNVLQMTREGLVSENLSSGEVENISHKKADYEYHKQSGLESAYNETNHKDYHTSTNAGIEDDNEEIEEAYKSPYDHGIYPFMANNALSDVNDKIADAVYEYKVSQYNENKRRYEFNQRKKIEEYEHKSKEQEFKNEKSQSQEFNRKKTDKEQYKFTCSSNKYKKFDRRINKADRKVQKLNERLPTRKRLKFNKQSGRLQFKKSSLTKKEYYKMRSLAKNTWNSIAESRRQNRDMLPASMISNTRKGLRFVDRTYKKWNKATRTIKKYTNPYAKLERAEQKAKEHRFQRDEFEYKRMSPEQKKTQKQLQKQMQKKRFHKAAVNRNMLQGQQRIVQNRNFFVKAKDSVVKYVKMLKTIASMIGAITTIIAIVAALLLGGGFIIAICISYGGTAVIQSTYQADYYQISDCSAYMQALETNLKERISKIESEEYPDCYEYIYNLGEIRHNSIELISYLAAKFVEFDLDTCQEELDSLFEEMYTLIIEIVEEPRERAKRDGYGQIIYDSEGNPVTETFMAKICYITLEVKPLEDIISERLDTDEKKAFDTYILSSGGQQIYSSCLLENWEQLISSKFGERIHPITGVRTFHNGIDIAVSTGTPLYSSTTGIVTTSAYSETAGNYIIVTMENGWCVKYMHLDTRNVLVGESVIKGQEIGATGNTGRSTGSHLHLEVRDADDNPIDPTFIIPSSSVVDEKASN